MLRSLQRHGLTSRRTATSALAATTSCTIANVLQPALVASRASVGMDLTTPAGALRTEDQTGEKGIINVAARDNAISGNKEIAETLAQNQTMDEVQYRQLDRPWDVVPQFKRRRVADMVGILKSEHRMEMEMTIEKISMVCDIDVYVVIVPTCGYVKPRVFAQSIFFDWGIGEPKGNGLLIVMCQREATVQALASPVLERYFADQFINLLVKDVLQPLLKEGDASYGILMMTHTAAQYIDEMRPQWENRMISQEVENKLRFAEKTVYFGMLRTTTFYVSIFCTLAIVWLVNRILDLYCPECGSLMSRVTDDEHLKKFMTNGQYLEYINECTRFRVHKCPNCEAGKRVRPYARDLYQDSKCLPCQDCNYNTVRLEKNVLKLPSKTEDGVKQFMYTCENCRVARDLRLPLMRPLEEKPEDAWYANLLTRAQNPMGEKSKRKLI